MNAQIVPSTPTDAYIIKNLYPLYIHDLSEFTGERPNQHGVLEPTPVATLVAQGEVQDIWWQKPGVLFPLLIRADDHVAGFAMVARSPHVPAGADLMLHEFFVLRPFRSRRVGGSAAAEILNRFRGRWRIEVLAKNLRAQSFWRRVLWRYTQNQFEERFAETGLDTGPMWLYQFDNTTMV
jgi:predicted acetyltransferase